MGWQANVYECCQCLARIAVLRHFDKVSETVLVLWVPSQNIERSRLCARAGGGIFCATESPCTRGAGQISRGPIRGLIGRATLEVHAHLLVGSRSLKGRNPCRAGPGPIDTEREDEGGQSFSGNYIEARRKPQTFEYDTVCRFPLVAQVLGGWEDGRTDFCTLWGSWCNGRRPPSRFATMPASIR